MRIPFPQTIPLPALLAILGFVLCVQLVQGTDPFFAVLMLIAQLCAAIAFNLMGGMTHMAGAFCLFAILPTVTVPEIAHLILGQAGDLNLVHPLTTAGVCAVFFICVMIAALFVSLMSHPVAFLERIQFSITELRIVSALSCVFAISIQFGFLTLNGPLQNGSFLAAVHHFYPFLLAISVMLATYLRIESTSGTSAMSWYIGSLLFLAVVPGILSASKEGMLLPFLCWVMVVASSRHRFSWIGTLGLAIMLFVAWTFVYPFSQNARSPVREAGSLSDKVGLIVQFFRDPSQFPDSISDRRESGQFGEESSKVGIIERYSLLQSIDMLIDADRKLGYTSIERYIPALFSIVPHALWPNKPAAIASNELGHKAGFPMGAGDDYTGIAIGSPALFFDLGGWPALIVYSLICFTIFFFASIRLLGTSESGIWALVPIGTEALIAGAAGPEAMFNLVELFLGVLITLIVILKGMSLFAEALISRPNPTQL